MMDQIVNLIDKIEGKVGIYAQRLDTEKKYLYHNSILFPSASVIKLPILYCLYKKCELDNISLDCQLSFQKKDIVGDSPLFEDNLVQNSFSLYQLAYFMITVSDNTATNILIDFIGINTINEFIKSIGMNKTFLKRKMYDFESRKIGIDNETSPEDIAILFRFLLKNKDEIRFINDIFKILFEQKDLEKIPSGFDNSFKIANKPGELDGVRNDASIIFHENNTYIINIFTENIIDEIKTDILIGKLARQIFEYLS
ncbi:MAG: serine hydrolase [Candidatus Sericytochromatia bacterium]|nr:serine hydrolase [Candidatus Sericytochromatia bacterium]